MTCDFCSNELIGYVQIEDNFPWVCEIHWEMYSKK